VADDRHTTRRAELWLGTRVEISADSPSRASREDGVVAAFAAIARVHHALSLHDRESELSQVNRNAPKRVQKLSPDLRSVLACALELAACSQGAFDPTVGGRVAALGFLPPQAESDQAASWRDVLLTRRGARFVRPLVLDFGGIAKGHAVDCAIEASRRHGVTSGCVNAGGDLRVFGDRSERVHLRTSGAHGMLLPLVSIADGAVATSAFGGQRRRIAGRWATPLIDPRTQLPMMSTRTISVVAPTCMVADALTKVVALRGSAAAGVLTAYGASASMLSSGAGRWRCSELPRALAAQRHRPPHPILPSPASV
jgi:FAD:protein FMN transferase